MENKKYRLHIIVVKRTLQLTNVIRYSVMISMFSALLWCTDVTKGNGAILVDNIWVIKRVGNRCIWLTFTGLFTLFDRLLLL